MEIFIMVNIIMDRNTDMEDFNGVMDACMKVNGLMIKLKGLEHKSFQMAQFIKENMKKTNGMVLV